MKWLYVVGLTVLFFSAFASATEEEFEEDGDARLGFITVTGGGATNVAFNATSIQNAVILGLFLLVLGALILPLIGLKSFGDEEGYGYAGESGYGADTGYAAPSTGYGSNFAKRSIEMLSPVLDALSNGQKKYENNAAY